MFDQFRDKFRLDNEKWDRYTNYFNKINVPAKTILLNEGEVSKKLFFIEKAVSEYVSIMTEKTLLRNSFLKKML
ncbi:Uncharacterised protein [Elizabethkingia miricola]|nr:Uncharacterised protein [Elizabethkingia miricola]